MLSLLKNSVDEDNVIINMTDQAPTPAQQRRLTQHRLTLSAQA
jgi:hypothetical protein